MKYRIGLFILFLISIYGSAFGQEVYTQHAPIVFDFAISATEETAAENPFLDYKLQISFTSNNKEFIVPGFYAADGNAAESSADAGGIWRVIFTPNKPGNWSYKVHFKKGHNVAIDDDSYIGTPIEKHHNKTGVFSVRTPKSDVVGFANSGRLKYANSRYLHTEDGKPFLKFGANSPENFLAYADIDNTYSYDKSKSFIKTWSSHIQDWKDGDPSWQNGKGKGIIGALNYLASKGMNSVYALSLNIEGDARDVWPFISHERKDFMRYDVSKLAQWDIIFSHAENLGIAIQILTQEKENELILDDGYTRTERKLYYRELIARFAHHKNIVWNMGEENGQANFWRQGQNDQQRFSMIRYLKDHDPYQNPIVIHTMSEPKEKELILSPLLGFDRLDGLSFQMSNPFEVHSEIKHWLEKAEEANRPWIITMDEIGPWHTGTKSDEESPRHDTMRQEVLWGALMAGASGVEWYFGWNKPPNDLNAEDWRSRNNMWEQTAIAHEFLKMIPYDKMQSNDELIDNEDAYCFSLEGSTYAIYTKETNSVNLNLTNQEGDFSVSWYDPIKGGVLQDGSSKTVTGGSEVNLGSPPNRSNQDWAILVQKID